MSNRINGDFNQETLDAFRSAYADRELQPEDIELDSLTGLPSNVVLNTSPWIQHTGLWKANDGSDRNFVPNQVLVPGEEVVNEDEDITDEELEELLNQLSLQGSDENEFEDEDDEGDTDFESRIQGLIDELDRLSQGDYEDEDETEEDLPLTDFEVNALLDEILSEDEPLDEFLDDGEFEEIGGSLDHIFEG